MNNSFNANPSVTALLRWVTTFESVVVIFSGFGLLFLFSVIASMWPWALTPFNASFLGAIYLTSAVAACILAAKARWSPARVVVPMILVFTAIVLVVSLLYLERFIRNSPSTWLWFALYIVIPINSAYHIWLYRRLPPTDTQPMPMWFRNLLLIEVVIFTAYGVGLLIAPATFSAFWPWKIDDFHGRMYCVAFLTPAVGAYLVSRNGSRVELITAGLTQIIGGVLTIVGFLMVENAQKRVDWSAAGTWAWMAFFLPLVVVGAAFICHGRHHPLKTYTTLQHRESFRIIRL
jgi:hypothetical protein